MGKLADIVVVHCRRVLGALGTLSALVGDVHNLMGIVGGKLSCRVNQLT
jgi:hypothetical protein